MSVKRQHAVATVVAVSVAIAAFAIFVMRPPHDPVAYHKQQMEQAYAAHYAEPDTFHDGLVGYTSGDEYEQYEFHRTELIELGAVLELDYQFKHLLVPSVEAEDFTQFILSENRPVCIEFSSPYPQDPEPLQLTVWCYPEHKAAWDDLIAKRDVLANNSNVLK